LLEIDLRFKIQIHVVLPFEYPPEEKAAGGEREAEKSAGRSWQSCK
jgi:hypothetical protein